MVVGASSGLGRGIAVGLGRRGARVALLARRQERLVEAAKEAGPEAVAIKAIDDSTFQMTTAGPLPYVLGALTHYSFTVVPIHAIEKFGKDWTKPENFVGNGPFKLESWKPQDRAAARPSLPPASVSSVRTRAAMSWSPTPPSPAATRSSSSCRQECASGISAAETEPSTSASA